MKFLELKRLVREALVDTVRFPKGPNCRDDAEDKPQDQDESGSKPSIASRDNPFLRRAGKSPFDLT